jgi:hypothetical protein
LGVKQRRAARRVPVCAGLTGQYCPPFTYRPHHWYGQIRGRGPFPAQPATLNHHHDETAERARVITRAQQHGGAAMLQRMIDPRRRCAADKVLQRHAHGLVLAQSLLIAGAPVQAAAGVVQRHPFGP